MCEPMNPLNPEAGDTPAPENPEDLWVVEQSARVMWRAFPYFEWRFGARGRAFGRSDAGFLQTLTELDFAASWQQVLWLARLLASRGIPSLLLMYQLESLGRIAARRGRPGAERLLALSQRLRRAHRTVLSDSVFLECERMCRAATTGVLARRGAGLLLAAAVSDRALGLGDNDEALERWLAQAGPEEAAWGQACAAARAHALAHCAPASAVPR